MAREDISRIDRSVKLWLLIVSVLCLALLAASAIREDFQTEWRARQREYGKILEAKATDEHGQSLLADHEVKLRQLVVPELGNTDRCVSCHLGIDDPRMTDVPNPHRIHPGELLSIHPPERFGCTICHRGQGLAVVFDEAKAEGYHWDYPMLPKELSQASCALCHTPNELADAGGERLAEGARLFNEKGCYSCHKLNGRGGDMGPALDNEGRKVKYQLPMGGVEGPHTLPQWLMEHFADPQAIVTGGKMKSPGLSYDQTIALTTYMLSLEQRDLPRSYLSPALFARLAEHGQSFETAGSKLYNRYCSNCHDQGTFGAYDKFYGKFMPAIRSRSFLAAADSAFIAENIRSGRPGTLMPAWGPGAGGLTDREIAALVEYIRSDNKAGVSASTVHVLTGDAAKGARIFTRHCVGCHGPGGTGFLAPAINNPVFQRTAGPEFIYRTVAYGRANTAMPAFLAPAHGGLSETDVADVVAYVRSLRNPIAVATNMNSSSEQKP